MNKRKENKLTNIASYQLISPAGLRNREKGGGDCSGILVWKYWISFHVIQRMEKSVHFPSLLQQFLSPSNKLPRKAAKLKEMSHSAERGSCSFNGRWREIKLHNKGPIKPNWATSQFSFKLPQNDGFWRDRERSPLSGPLEKTLRRETNHRNFFFLWHNCYDWSWRFHKGAKIREGEQKELWHLKLWCGSWNYFTPSSLKEALHREDTRMMMLVKAGIRGEIHWRRWDKNIITHAASPRSSKTCKTCLTIGNSRTKKHQVHHKKGLRWSYLFSFQWTVMAASDHLGSQ